MSSETQIPTSLATAANTLASFLAYEQVGQQLDLEAVGEALDDPHSSPQLLGTDVVVICASAVLQTCDEVFSKMAQYKRSIGQRKDRKVVLVLCGGIGHSTDLMHQAVAADVKFGTIAEEVMGLPEARVLQAIAERFYDLHVGDKLPGLTILVEDQSTNCGANASKVREVLECHGISSPRSIIVSQDPTMCRRTVASFEKVYSEESRPSLYSWPTFVPAVKDNQGPGGASIEDFLVYDTNKMHEISHSRLWSMERFMDLIIGEIPRLRDDSNGYGPNGKAFISHVDIPAEVEEGWRLLSNALDGHRTR